MQRMFWSRAARIGVLCIGAFGGAACATRVSPSPNAVVVSPAASQDDLEHVRRAALDYLEGFYEGDSAKLVRSVRPNVAKFGFWRPRDSVTFQPDSMTYAEFLTAARHTRARNAKVNPRWPKDVTIFDVQPLMASAKVTAWWGSDYLLLGKFGGQWMITHVLWQSTPKSP